MATQIQLDDIAVDVLFKDIKNIHLSIYPPTGRVRISAPLRMDVETIRVFTISKLNWIKRHQRKLQKQMRETPREYLERESHYVWGKRYLLKIIEDDTAPSVELKHSTMILRVRPGTNHETKHAIIAHWYRKQIKFAVTDLIPKWEAVIGVKVDRVFVQKMKTKWGSCNINTRNIRLNTELAKKPAHCLEYVVVHELVHLLERHHNDRFTEYMNRFMPSWRLYRDELNQAPLNHEHWQY